MLAAVVHGAVRLLREASSSRLLGFRQVSGVLGLELVVHSVSFGALVYTVGIKVSNLNLIVINF